MQRVNLKQGSLDWEKARMTRIGSSEVFDIVRYYATEQELLNCGIDALLFRAEKPYTTAWALYHKLVGDGLYSSAAIPPEFAIYGHAVEPYGVYSLQKGRARKLKAGGVYLSERLIASVDIEGIAEERDLIPFVNASGTPKIGQKFVCEQKTMLPQMIKNGLPFKYIIQAQYQTMKSKADFFILQLMTLDEDTPFERGKISQMSTRKMREYLDKKMTVSHYAFKNNVSLSRLIEECLNRFFDAVDNRHEPTPYLKCDNAQNIIESIRINSFFRDEAVCQFDLREYMAAKEAEKIAKARAEREKQKMIEAAKEHNACRFVSPDNSTAFFAANASIRVTLPKERAKI